MIQVGSTVGNFQITAVLGEGAMATVFLGEHPRIGKRVAIKVIHPELATSPEMVSRFFTEARAVSQIRHEHLVEIQDYGQTPEGDNFIIMEHLEGRTLAALIDPAGRLPAGRAVAIALQIAEALGAAHEHGVIHRDLKPDNIFLLRRGGSEDYVKVLDFGLAKLTGGAAAQRDHKTQTGSVLGTPHYMAPEQAEGKSTVDPRADVYSLGCILYRMLGGVLPFPGEGFGEVLVKHLREQPPVLRSLAPETPVAVEKVVLHAMAKRREFRFQSADELWQALREPERFSAYIGEDPRLIRGPNPGEPESYAPRPPFVGSLGRMGQAGGNMPGGAGLSAQAAAGQPYQPAPAAPASMSTAGAFAPPPAGGFVPQAVSPSAQSPHGVPVAPPEQRTMIAGMMAPALPQAGMHGMATMLQAPAPVLPQARPPGQMGASGASGGGYQPPGKVGASGGAGLAGPPGTGTLIADLSAPGMAAARSAVMAGTQGMPAYPQPGRPATAAPSRRGLLVGILAGAVVLGVGIGFVAPRLMKPKIYKVTVTSVPEKAQVLRSGALLGETPIELQLKGGDPPVRLTLRKDGYADALRALSAPAEPTLLVRMLAKQAPPPEEAGEGDDAKAAAVKDGDEDGAAKANQGAADKAADNKTATRPADDGKARPKEPAHKPREPAHKPKDDSKARPKEPTGSQAPKPPRKPKKPLDVVPF